MDFGKELIETQEHGNYEYIDSQLLPNLFLAYTKHSSGESGRFHNPIRFRFEQGDKEVIDAMKTFADYAQKARDALLKKDYESLGFLMSCNFNLRHRLYGDAAIGADNLKMIQIARDYSCPAKFCGSGGAIVGTFQTEEQFESLQRCLKNEGFECIGVVVDMPLVEH